MQHHLRAALIVAGLGLLTGACSREQPTEEGAHEEAEHPIILTTPKIMDVPTTQSYVCRLHSRRHIEIRALNEGYLEEIRIQEGQAVMAGDRLYDVYPVLYRTRLEAEKAELRLAEINLQNTQRLADKGFVSAPELARAKAERARAQANVDRATAEFGFTSILAPFDGIVGRQLMQQGSLIEEGDTLTTMSDNLVMWVYFNVPEADYLRFKALPGASSPDSPRTLDLPGATIQIRLANGQIYDKNAATTLTIESEFNRATGNIEFRADFPNPERLLRHGQTGTLLINRKIPKALVIPQQATFEILDRQYVYVVDENEVAHQRQITIAQELEDIFVLNTGLSADETFVLDGVRQVRDGERLEHTETVSPEEAVSNLKHHAE
ncbi:MAG: efflux RND transporter periplasmic adaptor subunit [Acidobacteria bacterium]|nr:efflux RND transporter periplasmic adaptor subunit [Acidobacteriota bacterium]